MATTYTIQVSDDPGAASRIPTEAASRSWVTKYDGPIATPAEARQAVNELSIFYQSVRAFRGKAAGKLWYAVLRHR